MRIDVHEILHTLFHHLDIDEIILVKDGLKIGLTSSSKLTIDDTTFHAPKKINHYSDDLIICNFKCSDVLSHFTKDNKTLKVSEPDEKGKRIVTKK